MADDTPLRSEAAALCILDADHPGWADLHLAVGTFSATYGFTLVFDPLDDIRRFARDRADSLRRNTGFLAVEHGLRPARNTPVGGWQALRNWLRGRRS
ncbi:hypothetical protein [Roseicyclus persicicus]|uniref:Uncharacterized protein n=1 Tax=Roseicyclus persicicus TaxID=2650661 RepID=A0A7X6H1P0_9RHOB|nr:hypothetical protein [Roseibacterium persicicum]NKX45202.1 hypothetical protein [Roseibacterium persicicum]